MSTNDAQADRQGPTIYCKNDPSHPFEFTCDEEPHMLGMQHGGPIGYIPLQIGQVFEDLEGGQYEIVRKLGWATNSSVWLAKHKRGLDERYVAVKILTVNYTRGIESGEFFELEVWRRFREVHYKSKAKPEASVHPGLKHCVVPQTVFTAESPHGTHLCFVTEPFGSTLDELQVGQPGFTFPLHVVKRAVRQTLLALDFLHTELDLVHADVKAGNLLIHLDTRTENIERYLRGHPSETYPPRSAPELWSGPIITVKSQPLPNMGLKPSLDNLNVSLGDFGGAVPLNRISPDIKIVTPPLLRPPELLLDHAWSTPIDIWAVGCTVFECLTGASLFQVERTPNLDETHVHLGRMVEHLGPFPAAFLKKCSKHADYFDDSGMPLRVPEPLGTGPLESWFGNFLHVRENLSDEDVRATCAFMRRCLAIDPAERATAAELLQDGWFEESR
ncbi:kinase-like protein [Lentinus tigrinus ALCF2SS1-6]|uniref:non-specific serine/threonine protein kinase n=1 Tax=Lentinus tigrinus ALCF2SS1-6 TaxID=1328759 RepID=A0A5C2RY97_9APHY|nr:kinase-like protein [Lentinus tigrinus ALCF2SS1-6]